MDQTKKSQFLALYRMVLADGVIDPLELETIYRIGTESYGLTQDEITDSLQNAGTSLQLPQTIEDKVKFLFNLAEVAWADGVIEPSEKELLRKYVIHLGFEEENAHQITEFMLNAVEKDQTVEEILSIILN